MINKQFGIYTTFSIFPYPYFDRDPLNYYSGHEIIKNMEKR